MIFQDEFGIFLVSKIDIKLITNARKETKLLDF